MYLIESMLCSYIVILLLSVLSEVLDITLFEVRGFNVRTLIWKRFSFYYAFFVLWEAIEMCCSKGKIKKLQLEYQMFILLRALITLQMPLTWSTVHTLLMSTSCWQWCGMGNNFVNHFTVLWIQSPYICKRNKKCFLRVEGQLLMLRLQIEGNNFITFNLARF